MHLKNKTYIVDAKYEILIIQPMEMGVKLRFRVN